ncbi:MAG: NAD(P)H-hydrate epimerase, partial [Deltaproteobacteria bacterium]|nr:NAD(P)H-hydrate epimerase [Deltaproteobacteria bacterium]
MAFLTGIRICSSQEMREIDQIAEREYNVDTQILMENAGKSCLQVLLDKYPHAGRTTEILIFTGKGNNAGDAFTLARHLLCLERRVRIFHLNPSNKYVGVTQKNFEILKHMRAKLTFIETISDLESFFKSSIGPFTIVDGILGTGLKGNVDGIFYDVIEMINKQKYNEVVSIDIPSGVNGDTGQIYGTSILATLTISLGFPKLGHFLPPGAARRGDLVNVDISLPPKFRKEGDQFLLTKAPLSVLIKERDRYGHKNSFGHTLLIGGSAGRLGAIAMAAQACHRMGTGLVTVATWDDCFQTLFTKLPVETMSIPIKVTENEIEFYKRNLDFYTSIVVGPGLGVSDQGKLIIRELLKTYRGPMVIDADALNIISEYKLDEFLRGRLE